MVPPNFVLNPEPDLTNNVIYSYFLSGALWQVLLLAGNLEDTPTYFCLSFSLSFGLSNAAWPFLQTFSYTSGKPPDGSYLAFIAS